MVTRVRRDAEGTKARMVLSPVLSSNYGADVGSFASDRQVA
jgi:hypothetical protein